MQRVCVSASRCEPALESSSTMSARFLGPTRLLAGSKLREEPDRRWSLQQGLERLGALGSFLARLGVSLAAIRFCAAAIATSTASFRSSRTASISARAIFSSASFMRRSTCSFSDWRVSTARVSACLAASAMMLSTSVTTSPSLRRLSASSFSASFRSRRTSSSSLLIRSARASSSFATFLWTPR